jgi:4-hydroxybenzoate polyprenyltransferase
MRYAIVIPCFLLSALFISGYGYFINDAADAEADRLSGKKNMAAGLSLSLQIVIVLLLVTPGLVIFTFVTRHLFPFLYVALQLFALSLYSLRPFRLKDHPLAGPFLDAHYGHILPVFIALSVFFYRPYLPPYTTIFLILFYFLLLAKGLRNILLHQLGDRKADKRASLATFPVKYGALPTLNIINRLLLPAELTLLVSCCIIGVDSFPLLLYGLLTFLVFYALNFSAWEFPKLPPVQLRFKFLYFLNDFYEYWLPYLCIWSCGLTTIQKGILTAVHALLFYKGIVKFYRDARKIGVNLGLLRKV